MYGTKRVGRFLFPFRRWPARASAAARSFDRCLRSKNGSFRPAGRPALRGCTRCLWRVSFCRALPYNSSGAFACTLRNHAWARSVKILEPKPFQNSKLVYSVERLLVPGFCFFLPKRRSERLYAFTPYTWSPDPISTVISTVVGRARAPCFN